MQGVDKINVAVTMTLVPFISAKYPPTNPPTTPDIPNINVNEPEYIDLISPGGAVSDTSNNIVYSTFPVFTWSSDNCSVCETEIRVCEFNPENHSSPIDAINDMPSLPNISGDEYYSIDDNINAFQYPTSDAKNLEIGKL